MPKNVTLQDVAQLQRQSQSAIYEDGNYYGRIGIISAGVWQIPSAENGKPYKSVTLDDGTIITATCTKVTATPELRVRVRLENQQWLVKGLDERPAHNKSTDSTYGIARHNHNKGTPLHYSIDTASIEDGMVTPTLSGLNVTIGRTVYPKRDGSLGIYAGGDTQDLSSGAVASADEGRWIVHYINRADGTAGFHVPPVATPPLNITTHIEAAVLDCLQNVEDAFPFAVSRIRAGRTSFDTYTPMAGDGDLSAKDFIRLGFGAYDLNPTYTVETTDDTWTTILSIALAEDETAHVRATVLGKKDSISTSDDICPLTAEAQFYRLSGGDVTQFGVNGIHKAQTSNGMARWNTTSTHIQLQVQGVSAEDWRWSARITEKQIV